MRVLVTGSHGFIGSQLVLALKERGDEVILSDPKVHHSLFELENFPITDFNEIYHLACINQEQALSDPEENLWVNAYGAKLMAEMAVETGARFVYTSTASVYGNSMMLPIPSHYPPTPKSDYAVAKLAGEHFVKNSGADYSVFRLSNVYGPGQTTENPYCGVVAKFFEAAIDGNPLQIIGDGSQTRDFTYVEDILPHLMNPELKGLLNCSHGVETSVKDLMRGICELKPRGYHGVLMENVPERPVDGIQRRCLISDVTCPTDLKIGLQKTYDWILAQNSAVFDDSSRKALL
jgi:UDP-glucose 4-epimerase